MTRDRSILRHVVKLYTVDSLLTDTSIRRTNMQNGHLELAPAFLSSLYLTFYKTDISLRRTASAGPKGVRLRESWLYSRSKLAALKLHLKALIHD